MQPITNLSEGTGYAGAYQHIYLIFIQLVPGGNCIKIGLPGKSILGDYFQENRTSRRPFLLMRISFRGRPVFIQLPPGTLLQMLHSQLHEEPEAQYDMYEKFIQRSKVRLWAINIDLSCI